VINQGVGCIVRVGGRGCSTIEFSDGHEDDESEGVVEISEEEKDDHHKGSSYFILPPNPKKVLSTPHLDQRKQNRCPS